MVTGGHKGQGGQSGQDDQGGLGGHGGEEGQGDQAGRACLGGEGCIELPGELKHPEKRPRITSISKLGLILIFSRLCSQFSSPQCAPTTHPMPK